MSTPPPVPPPLPSRRHGAEQPRKGRDLSEWVGSNRGLLIVVLILGVLTLTAGSVAFLFWKAQHHEVYEMAIARAGTHPAVIDALGAPVEEAKFGPFPVGICSQSSFDGKKIAVAVIYLKGSKGYGVLHATATKTTGTWEFEMMTLEHREKTVRILPEGAAVNKKGEWPD